MTRAAALAALMLPALLAACGAARELKPRPGETLPVAPYGARATPTRDQLIKPTTQQRPARSDDLLIQSDARRSDEFDLRPGLPIPAPTATPTPRATPTPVPTAGG